MIRRIMLRSRHGHIMLLVGSDGDPLLVLDSRFRVVDRSAFPRSPGVS